jgi:hypothetical protein
VIVQRALRIDGGGDRIARAGEREEERVALRVDLRAAPLTEALADETPVVAGDVSVSLVAELLEELGRALDVGEDERDGAAGQELIAPTLTR